MKKAYEALEAFFKKKSQPITTEYLKKYLNEPHPKEGTALNIIANLNIPDHDKMNLLHCFVSQGADRYKALEFALKTKNNIQLKYLCEHLEFSLIEAIKNKNFTGVKFLIEEIGADINVIIFGSSPLSVANKLEEPHKTIIINYLLERGAKPLETNIENEFDNNSEPPLMLAAKEGDVKTVKSLLENSINPNTQGWEHSNLLNDVSFQVNQVSKIWEKINDTSINLQDLKKHINNSLNPIFSTILSSKYTKYKNINEKEMQEMFPKLLAQLYQDLQNFTEIANLLKSYSKTKAEKLEEYIVTTSEENSVINLDSEEVNINYKLVDKTPLIGESEISTSSDNSENIFEIDV